MNPNELRDTFEQARGQALREAKAADDVRLVYKIRDPEWGTKHGVCSDEDYLCGSHQWLRANEIVYCTDEA